MEPYSLTLDEACHFLKISRPTATNWIRTGRLSEQMEHQRLRSGRCASTARHHGYQLVVVQELKISVSMTSDTPGQAG